MKVFWPKTPKPGNFGDVITPFLLREMGVDFQWSGQRSRDKFLGCGSIARFAKAGDVIWGSGIISQRDKIDEGATALCVRGPITGEKCGCRVYGDPGLLMPMFCESATRLNNIGVFPHYVHINKAKHPYISPLTDKPRIVAKAISSYKGIVSSSLHGIIVAHAYGVPAGWWKPDDALTGDDIKFKDYADSVGITLQSAEKIKDVELVLPERARIEALQHNLLKSLKTWMRRS